MATVRVITRIDGICNERHVQVDPAVLRDKFSRGAGEFVEFWRGVAAGKCATVVPEKFERTVEDRSARPRASEAAPSSQQRGAASRRISESNPWPRGRRGWRFELLKLLGESPAKAVGAGELRLRVPLEKGHVRLTMNEACNTLRILCIQGFAERSDETANYRYRITPLGLNALKAGA